MPLTGPEFILPKEKTLGGVPPAKNIFLSSEPDPESESLANIDEEPVLHTGSIASIRASLISVFTASPNASTSSIHPAATTMFFRLHGNPSPLIDWK